MGTYAKFVGEFDVEGTPFKMRVNDIYDNGACQCFRDCDYYQQKGTFLRRDERYMHPFSDKNFDSLKSCQMSYDAKKGKLA